MDSYIYSDMHFAYILRDIFSKCHLCYIQFCVIISIVYLCILTFYSWKPKNIFIIFIIFIFYKNFQIIDSHPYMQWNISMFDMFRFAEFLPSPQFIIRYIAIILLSKLGLDASLEVTLFHILYFYSTIILLFFISVFQ